jgi:peptidoglycan/xylan/chitin deacetylase (PgdA/CDA1 family)
MPGGLKRAALAALAAPGLTAPFYPLMRGRATIFMLHRFLAPDLGIHEGQDPADLRRGLALLRRRGYDLLPLGELFRRLSGDGPPPSRAVAFTLDDGYLEQAVVAGPIFAEFDCPATVFVTSGFLDGRLWFWWDRIAHIFRHTTRTRLTVEMDETPMDMAWSDPPSRASAEAGFVARCKLVPDAAKHAAIARLAEVAGVELPAAPPTGHEPMSWDLLRRWESKGLTFGPHTVTHPVLSRTTDEASRFELEESWRRLAAEATRPVRVFCYPNGGWQDFGPRETATLRALDFQGAVVGEWGFASRTRTMRGGEEPFHVRRIPWPDDLPHMVQYVSGMERFKMVLRGMDA